MVPKYHDIIFHYLLSFRTCEKVHEENQNLTEFLQSKLNGFEYINFGKNFDVAPTVEKYCPDGYRRRYSENHCKDDFEFLEEENNEGKKNIKVELTKGFFFNRKLHANEFCIDINEEHGFRIGLCKKEVDNTKFK